MRRYFHVRFQRNAPMQLFLWNLIYININFYVHRGLYFIQFISGHKVKQLEQDLEELVHKKCEQSDTIITLPIEALMKFNVTSLSLNEPSCMGVKNETLGVWVRFVCKICSIP